MLDELVRWNDADPVFRERLDLTKVAAMGMSWGGGVAGEFGRMTTGVRAVVLLDGLTSQDADELVRSGCRSRSSACIAPRSEVKRGFSTRQPGCRVVPDQFVAAREFRGWYWWSYPDNLADGREAARTINAYTLWFLNKYLKGSTDPMPALADYPRVINFKQK